MGGRPSAAAGYPLRYRVVLGVAAIAVALQESQAFIVPLADRTGGTGG